jgi:hypothetical protein
MIYLKMKTYYTIKEIVENEWTTLKERQIRNKVLKLKLTHPNYVIGGERKRNNKYLIHFTLLNYVTERILLKDNTNTKTTIKRLNDLKEIYKREFLETEWDYFVGINPSNEVSIETFKKCLERFNCKSFFAIHYCFERGINHIHFVYKDNNQNSISEFIKSIGVYCGNPHWVKFDKTLNEDCFNYMIMEGSNKNNCDQTLMEYGIIENVY